MPKGSVLFDVGANIGVYSVYAAARGLEVVAVEPIPASFSALCKSVVLNGLEVRVTPVCLALGDWQGTVRIGENVAGSASHGGGGLRTAVTTLDALADVLGIAPTHLKIDTDGFDLQVLRGGARTLEKVGSVLVEVDTRRPDAAAIRGLMEAAGFAREGRFVSPLTPQSPIGMELWLRPQKEQP